MIVEARTMYRKAHQSYGQFDEYQVQKSAKTGHLEVWEDYAMTRWFASLWNRIFKVKKSIQI